MLQTSIKNESEGLVDEQDTVQCVLLEMYTDIATFFQELHNSKTD